MLKKIVIVLAAMFALSACSGTKRSMDSSAENALIEQFQKEVGDRVFFKFDSSALSSESKAQIQKQAAWLTARPNIKITVEGHCDVRGTTEYNLALGERRAAAVAEAFKNFGIESARIETISYGKERPAVVGNDEQAYGQNRRGVVVPAQK